MHTYTLVETNSDLIAVKTLFDSKSFDIIESIMVKAFKENLFETDFIILDETFNIVASCFSARTFRLRGECNN